MSYRKNIELLIKSKNKEANGEYILVYCNEFKFDINEGYKIETDIVMNRSKIIFNQQVDYNYLFSSLTNLGGKIYEAIVNKSDFDNIVISIETFSTMIKQYELENNEPILKLIIDFIKNFGYPYKIKKDYNSFNYTVFAVQCMYFFIISKLCDKILVQDPDCSIDISKSKRVLNFDLVNYKLKDCIHYNKIKKYAFILNEYIYMNDLFGTREKLDSIDIKNLMDYLSKFVNDFGKQFDVNNRIRGVIYKEETHSFDLIYYFDSIISLSYDILLRNFINSNIKCCKECNDYFVGHGNSIYCELCRRKRDNKKTRYQKKSS